MVASNNHIQDQINAEEDTTLLAFLELGIDEQINYLETTPIDEALEVLHLCSIAKVQHLLAMLETDGQDKLARQYANRLGFIYSEVDIAKSYLATSVYEHVKQRIGWIIALALLGIVSGLIIAQYEDTLSQLVLLAVYMPVIGAAGGNTGTQSATLVIRGLATGEIKKRQWLQVIWKESRVSIFIALALGAVVSVRVIFFSNPHAAGGFDLHLIALAIAVAIFIQVTISTTLGGVLPIIARALNLDPAVLVSPVLASIVDISGMCIYFSVANYFLGIG